MYPLLLKNNLDLSCNKKNWFGLKKIRYVFVYVKKKVFGEEKKIRSVLLSKTKSFGSKISDMFWNKVKNWFLVCM